MPIARFQMPDGRIARFEVPDGTTPEQAQSMMEQYVQTMPEQVQTPKQPTQADRIRQNDKDVLGGLVRGAGSIGATILAPADMINSALAGDGFFNLDRNRQRRKDIDSGVRELFGSDPESLGYKTGKLGSEIMGTAGTGNVLAKGVQSIPMLAKAVPNLAPALQSGGFRVAQKATDMPGQIANAAIRTGAGAVTGGAMAGTINPEDAAMGAVLGGAMPGTFKVAGEIGKGVAAAGKAGSRRLMQSAIKPTIKQLQTGDARVAVDTMLDYGLSPNKRGVEKMRGMVDDLNTQIADRLAGSNAIISKQSVVPYLKEPFMRAMSQVSPTGDINAIKGVADDFLAHPALPGDMIPVQAAQNLKQGTYRALSKKYGQLGSAEVEAQKALARGLKDKIADVVPGIGALNAEESRLIKTLSVAERRALMEMNKNPMGLSILAGNKAAFIAFLADRSAAFKALAARMVNRASEVPAAVGPLGEQFANPALRSGLLSIESNP